MIEFKAHRTLTPMGFVTRLSIRAIYALLINEAGNKWRGRGWGSKLVSVVVLGMGEVVK
jgi:hypothetical protein